MLLYKFFTLLFSSGDSKSYSRIPLRKNLLENGGKGSIGVTGVISIKESDAAFQKDNASSFAVATPIYYIKIELIRTS